MTKRVVALQVRDVRVGGVGVRHVGGEGAVRAGPAQGVRSWGRHRPSRHRGMAERRAVHGAAVDVIAVHLQHKTRSVRYCTVWQAKRQAEAGRRAKRQAERQAERTAWPYGWPWRYRGGAGPGGAGRGGGWWGGAIRVGEEKGAIKIRERRLPSGNLCLFCSFTAVIFLLFCFRRYGPSSMFAGERVCVSVSEPMLDTVRTCG